MVVVDELVVVVLDVVVELVVVELVVVVVVAARPQVLDTCVQVFALALQVHLHCPAQGGGVVVVEVVVEVVQLVPHGVPVPGKSTI